MPEPRDLATPPRPARRPPTRPRHLLIEGGEVLTEEGWRRADVLVEEGAVVEVGDRIERPAGATVLDAGGCAVGPGLVDLHTHLRQPGGETAETVLTGSRAAALGGYTAVVAMPNTDPPIDDASVVRDVLELAGQALVAVAVAGAITLGREGSTLAPMAEMAALGVHLFTDDGRGVQDGAVMRRALEYARPLGVVLAQHSEDESLAAGGSMHEGAWSSRLGIPGRPAVAEEAMIARDLALLAITGGRLHVLHCSTAGAAALIARAKTAGLPVSAEVTPHHLSLTDAECAGFDPVFKVNPPLRCGEDVEALRSALIEGTIDAVATDHAPHPPESKEEPFEHAPPGMLGLETALAVLWCEALAAVGGDQARAALLFERCSTAPAAVAGLAARHGGPVRAGRPANLCVADLALRWVVEPARLASLSRNTPFAGRTLTGRARHTVVEGEPVVRDGAAQR